MANATHVRLAATAQRLIAANGRAMQLRSFVESGPEYNPVRTPVDQDITAVQTRLDNREVDGQNIMSTDRMYLLDSQHDPNSFEKLVDGSVEYDIVNAQEIAPGDTSIIYRVQAR